MGCTWVCKFKIHVWMVSYKRWSCVYLNCSWRHNKCRTDSLQPVCYQSLLTLSHSFRNKCALLLIAAYSFDFLQLKFECIYHLKYFIFKLFLSFALPFFIFLRSFQIKYYYAPKKLKNPVQHMAKLGLRLLVCCRSFLVFWSVMLCDFWLNSFCVFLVSVQLNKHRKDCSKYNLLYL